MEPAETISSREPSEMTLRDYGAVLVRRRWFVILPLVFTTMVAAGLATLETEVYAAESEVLIEPRGQDGLFDNRVLSLNERAIATEIEVIEGEQVRSRVQSDLGLAVPPPAPDAASVPQTDVIRIEVRSSNARNAATLADAYGQAYSDLRREELVDEHRAASDELVVSIGDVQAEIATLADDDPRRNGLVNQLADLQTTLDQLRVDAALLTSGAKIITSAVVPSTPVEPTPLRTAALAAVIGLLLGLGAAFLVEYLDGRVWTADALQALVGAPVLASVPADPPPDNRPISLSVPEHASVEAYRGLRTSLRFVLLDEPLKVIQITSALPAEGKTTTSANLAVVLAQAGHRVAFVDADLRRPTVHRMMAVPQAPGLVDLLLGADADQVAFRLEVEGGGQLDVYASGHPPGNPSELMSSARIREVLAEMSARYDYVVVDSAPVLPVSDSMALATAVDGVLLVAQAGRITADNATETIERLRRVHATVLGLVLNQTPRATRESYAYGAYGGYSTAGATIPSERLRAQPDSPQHDDLLLPER